MNTRSSSGNDFVAPQRRTPETLSLQRSSSQDSRVTALSTALSPSNHGTPRSASSNNTSPISPETWTYPQQPTNLSRNNSLQRHSSADQTGRISQQPSSSSMIGPTTSYYDPDQALAHQTQETVNYQRWVEAYGSGPPQDQMDFMRGNHHNVAAGIQYAQQRQQAQHQHQTQQQTQQNLAGRVPHPPPEQPVPMQNQYNFVPDQYAPTAPSAPSGIDHHFLPNSGRQPAQLAQTTPQTGASARPTGADYSSSVRTHQPQSGGSLHGAVGYNPVPQQQTMNNELYYYPQQELVGTGDQSHSYGYSAGGQQTEQPYTSPVEPFTPASELHTLPAHNSVSPPWTAERLPQNSYAPGSSKSQPPRSGQTAAKKERGSAKKVASRKRPRQSGGARDSDSESDEDAFEPVQTPPRGPDNMPTRLPGACTHCKRLKMKCDFPKNENTCKRCKAGGHHCIVEGRKPRTAPNKREYLLAQIRQKDSIIESLLKQLHNPYMATPLSIASYRMATSPSDQNNRDIIAWLDKLQGSVQSAGVAAGDHVFKLDSRAKTEYDSDHDSDIQDEEYDLIDDEDRGTEKMSSLPDPTVPLGLIAKMSLSNPKAKAASNNGDIASTDTLDDDNVGVANETYFMPGPANDLQARAMLIEQHSPPEILVHGLVAPEDVEKLFDIFFERINCFISVLDPKLHTPASTFARCPFLFTVICAISSRYYTEKSEIYPIAMHFAKHAAANALIDGWKSVELCQAYILMSIYAVPARRWEEDRSWLYIGLAIRIATDLNLHLVTNTKASTELQERENLNKARVWMNCFNLDRSTATQFGKPSTIKEDYIVRNSSDWYKKSPYNHKFDVHLCAYSAMLRIVAAFHDEVFSDPSTPSGLNKHIDFRAVTLRHDENLTRYHEEWTKRFAEASLVDDRGSAFRCTLLPFLTNYSRLVMFSFGFQQAYQRGFEHGDEIFFSKCFEAAKAVIKNFIECLAPSGYMRFSADGHFVFSSFASAFLLKLLRPEFANLMTPELETDIFDLIGRLIQTFSSPEIAIDDRHTPKLYARFLAGLLTRAKKDGAAIGRLQTHPPPQNDVAHSASGGYNPHIPTSTNPSFAVTPPEGDLQGHHDGGFPQTTFNPDIDKAGQPIYQPEPSYTLGNPAIDFDASGDLGPTGSATFSDEEMLATMQALKNPQWWSTMMMPGFSWPGDTPMANGTNTQEPIYSQNVPGLHHQGFGGYQPPEIPLN